MDKYLFTFTLRADGTSRFHPDNRWGYFPAAAFAWKIKEESFLKDQANMLEEQLAQIKKRLEELKKQDKEEK